MPQSTIPGNPSASSFALYARRARWIWLGSLLWLPLVSAAGWCGAQKQLAGLRLEQLPQVWLDDMAHDLLLDSLRGHRVVLTMAYATCHRICPMTMSALQRMQEIFDERGESVDFVIVGYDSSADGPAAWRVYRAQRRLNRGNWHFLTGTRLATRRLADELDFPFWTYDEHVMHEPRAVLFDAAGIQRAALGAPVSQWADSL